jgi:hypothetical protein
MAIDLQTGIDEAFAKLGSTEGQRADAVLVLASRCSMQGDAVILNETGLPIDDAKSKAWIETNKPHLLPPKFEQSLADRAFLDGNVTARGQLLREVGEAEATRIAQQYGLKNLADTRRGARPAGANEGKRNGKDRNNPWLADQWNVSRQGNVVRTLGVEAATRIASAAGCRLGSTKPNPQYN